MQREGAKGGCKLGASRGCGKAGGRPPTRWRSSRVSALRLALSHVAYAPMLKSVSSAFAVPSSKSVRALSEKEMM